MGKGGQDREWNHTTTWNKDRNGQFAEEPSSILSGVSFTSPTQPPGVPMPCAAAAGGTLYLKQMIFAAVGAGGDATVTDSNGAIVVQTGGGAAVTGANGPTVVTFEPPINCGDLATFTSVTDTYTGVTLNFIQQINTNNE